ncbi:hypothetical protein Tco_0383164 [Tanacetum coccineum]
MTKAQDLRSHNMKEQAYNKDKDQDSRTQRQSNLHKSTELRFKDLPSWEIVSLKILRSRKSPTAMLFDVDTGRISIRHCEMLKRTTLNVLARSRG